MLSIFRPDLCDDKVTMNGEAITYAISKYASYVFYNENGQPEGTMVDHMELLSKYIDFVPLLHVSNTFVERLEMVESGKAKIGAIGSASFL